MFMLVHGNATERCNVSCIQFDILGNQWRNFMIKLDKTMYFDLALNSHVKHVHIIYVIMEISSALVT